jgi:hypothetical protein
LIWHTLTPTLVSLTETECRDESRHGTHECVRHVGQRYSWRRAIVRSIREALRAGK